MSRKKGNIKTKVGVSVDIETWEKLESYCESNSVNKSKLIDKLIKEFLFKKDESLLEKEKIKYV